MDLFEKLIEKYKTNSLKLDIHYHSIFSDCSNLNMDEVSNFVNTHHLPLFTMTDHGTTRGCRELEKRCLDTKIVWAVEITAQEGDFLVYSLDEDYVSSLSTFQDSVKCLERNDHTAIIWAHPRIPTRESIGWTSPTPQNKKLMEVIKHIDGLEIYNGTMLELTVNSIVQRVYFSNLVRIASKGNENGQLALTGASDAHDSAHFFTAWTRFSEDVKTPEDFIRALKNHQVCPDFDQEIYKIRVP